MIWFYLFELIINSLLKQIGELTLINVLEESLCWVYSGLCFVTIRLPAPHHPPGHCLISQRTLTRIRRSCIWPIISNVTWPFMFQFCVICLLLCLISMALKNNTVYSLWAHTWEPMRFYLLSSVPKEANHSPALQWVCSWSHNVLKSSHS